MALCNGCGKLYSPSEGEGYDGYCDACVEFCTECGTEITPLDSDCYGGMCESCFDENEE
jgi:hypothetical protein